MWEKCWPHLLGVTCAAGYICFFQYWLKQPVRVPKNFREVLTAVITVAGVAVAFIAAIQGIFLTLGSTNSVVDRLKELGAYDHLLNYFASAIRWCLFLVAFSMAGYFFEMPESDLSRPQMSYFVLWMFLIGTTGGACYRITKLFDRTLRS